MSEEIISKEELSKLMKINGEVRMVGIKSYLDFILKEEGEEGLKKIEEAMLSFGFPLKREKIRKMDFYPLNQLAVLLVTIKKLFNYSDEKFQEMGTFQVRGSLLLTMLVKYLVSLNRAAKELPNLWRKHLTVGDLIAVELNEEKKYLIMRLENYRMHPIHCQILKGYFLASLQRIIRETGTCEETKCIFRGDDYHEFLVKW